MQEDTTEYILDFAIPSGDIGSIASEPSIFVKYNDTSTNGNLNIANTMIVPPHSTIFSSDEQYVFFSETGYFEFVLNGIVKENTTNMGATVILKTRNTSGHTNNLITIQLRPGIKEKYFSQRKMGQYGTLQRVMVILQKDNNSDCSIENVTLYINKLIFPNI